MPYPSLFSPPWDAPLNGLACLDALSFVDPWNPNLAGVVPWQSSVFPGSVVTSTTFVKTSITPNAFWLFADNNVVLVVGGTDGTQVPSLLSSWLNSQQSRSPAGALLAFSQSCSELLASPPQRLIGQGLQWWLIGHSFGGSVCEVMAQIVAQNMAPSSIVCWSFGAPRPGNEQFQRQFLGAQSFRFFNDMDVVPVLPPHTNESAISQFALPVSSAQFCNGQVQIANGRSIASDGTITNTEETSLPFPIVEPSLAAWISGATFWQAQSHSPAEYRRRLMLSPAPPANPIGPNRTAPSDLEQPLDLSVRQLNRAIDQAIDTLPSSTVPTVLPVMTPATTTSRYFIRHRRGGWGVWFQGTMIAFSRSKRTARLIARTGNGINKTAGKIAKV